MSEKDRIFSRFTSKLLRRSSSSASAKTAINRPSSTTTNITSTSQGHNEIYPDQGQRRPRSTQLHSRSHVSSTSSTLSARVSDTTVGSSSSTIRVKRRSGSDKEIAPDIVEVEEPNSSPLVKQQSKCESINGQFDISPTSSNPCRPVSVPTTSTPRPEAVRQFPAAGEASSAATRNRTVEPQIEGPSGRRFEDYSFQPPPPQDGAPYSSRPPRTFNPRATAPHSVRGVRLLDETLQERPPSSYSNHNINTPPIPKHPPRPTLAVRRQSLVPSSQQRLIKTLLDPSTSSNTSGDYSSRGSPYIQADMVHRKVWVRRPGASPTLVLVTEEDLVDDLRDAILKKYANSLGRNCDSPDIVIKLAHRQPSSRQSHHERILGPEEHVGRTLDHYYPGGQLVEEALIIEVPQRRTPKPSPLAHTTYVHPGDVRSGEAGEYFPPMSMIQTPNVSSSISSSSGPSSHQTHQTHQTHQPSMSVLTTGQLPAVPSPGSRGSWQQHQQRVAYSHQHSPTIVQSPPINDSVNSPINGIPSASPPPSASTPPAPAPEPASKPTPTPPSRVSSPRPKKAGKVLKDHSGSAGTGSLPPSLLDGTVPPINVLIVEDNTINLKLLEAFMKRLKVRWQTAMNGRDAVNKWRNGGFHLVLMDIQLPVMNGLEATREIRRLERLNNIGVFSRTVSGPSSPNNVASSSTGTLYQNSMPARRSGDELAKPEDMLDKQSQFKSPVIIVALTASSLQSDRHEALAAGCNDFLTKPVNIMWLEQKVTEWGCMQALIDFEGWRRWRGFANPPEDTSINPIGTITRSPITESPQMGAQARRPHAIGTVLGNGNQKSESPGRERASSQSKRNGLFEITNGMNSSTNSSTTVIPNGETQMSRPLQQG